MSSVQHTKGLNWQRMTGRAPDEHHRAATTLELLFDLIFVVAIAFAGAELHHAIAANHAAHGVMGFMMVFFAIWWAWIGFTWFASSFDTDDVPYRIMVLVQMAGALVIAAGVPSAFEHSDFKVVTAGYAIMRIASVVQWLRAAYQAPARRATALRYAMGVFVVQIGWGALLFVPQSVWWGAYFLMIAAEFAVPLWAERAGMTPWHPHHIAERYGLLTIIVLGESILAAANAIQKGLGANLLSVNFALFCIGALLVVFCMWWLYFEDEVADRLQDYRTAFLWGYGHYFIFAAAAAAGAGLAALVDARMGLAQASDLTVGFGLAIPVAIYVFFTWLMHKRVSQPKGTWVFPLAALLILTTPWLTNYTTLSIALILVLALVVRATVCGLHTRSSHV